MGGGAGLSRTRGSGGRTIARYGATILYAAPTAIRTFIKWGADIPAEHDLSSLRLLGSVGEPINPKAWLWYHKVIGGERCPIVDTWWQTETGAIMITPLPGITATKPGSATTPFPGVAAEVVGEGDGEPVGTDQGLLTLTRPWPSMLRTLYREEDRFVETYFEKFGKETYLVGDAARQDEDGYFWVIGRIDDVVNVSGHRLSTAEVESAIVAPREGRRGGRDRPVRRADRPGDLRLRHPRRRDRAERRAGRGDPRRRRRAGSANSPARSGSIWADDLPKTRSGKIMRRLLRDIAEGRALGDVTTLRDPDVMKELEAKIAESSRTRTSRRVRWSIICSTAISRAWSCSRTLRSSRRAIASAESSSLLELFLDLGDLGAEEALGEGAGEQGDEADADDQDHGRDDLAARRRRVDVRAERRHRRHRPVDPVPGVEVLGAALEGDEEGAAADHGQHREQHRVAQALEREDLVGELREAQQAQEPEEAEDPERLQAGGEERRREEDDRRVERVVAEPGPAVGDDREHHDQLDREGEPGRPVEDHGDGLQPAAGPRLGDRDHRQRQRRGDQHRRFEAFGDPRAAGVHPLLVVVGGGLPSLGHPRLFRRRPRGAYLRRAAWLSRVGACGSQRKRRLAIRAPASAQSASTSTFWNSRPLPLAPGASEVCRPSARW